VDGSISARCAAFRVSGHVGEPSGPAREKRNGLRDAYSKKREKFERLIDVVVFRPTKGGKEKKRSLLGEKENSEKEGKAWKFPVK